ncbi:MAG: hypothetical protein CL878_03620 [Dehalococcoidia bacterium]|nr:hypothetical protein [Dehalococcoidia bacterium]
MVSRSRRGRGEGTIFRRKSDGDWVAELYLGVDGQGKRRFWRKYGKTREAVADALAEAQLARRLGTLREAERSTVADYLEWWLTVTQPTLAPKTWQRYSELVRLHLTPQLGRYQLRALRPEHVQALQAEKLAAGLSPLTSADAEPTATAEPAPLATAVPTSPPPSPTTAPTATAIPPTATRPPPTATRSPPTATFHPATETPPPTATQTPQPTTTAFVPVTVYVGNTDGDGVYLRKTRDLDDRLTAYVDNTQLLVLGPGFQQDDIIWVFVRAPDGSEGYVPSQYIVAEPQPTVTAAPSATPPPATATGAAPTATTIPVPAAATTVPPTPTSPPPATTTPRPTPSAVVAVAAIAPPLPSTATAVPPAPTTPPSATATPEPTASPVLPAATTTPAPPTPTRSPLPTSTPQPTASPMVPTATTAPPPTSTPTPVPPTPTSQPPTETATASGFDPANFIGQGNAFNCGDFGSQAQAQAVLRADPSDPNRLDNDRDGLACEGLPAPKDLTPVPRA